MSYQQGEVEIIKNKGVGIRTLITGDYSNISVNYYYIGTKAEVQALIDDLTEIIKEL